jgi:hypothetical protein
MIKMGKVELMRLPKTRNGKARGESELVFLYLDG